MTGLPPDDAATFREEKPGWTKQDELLARVVEVSDFWGRFQFQMLHGLATGKWPAKKSMPPLQTVEHPARTEVAQEEKRGKRRDRGPVEKDPDKIKRWFRGR